MIDKKTHCFPLYDWLLGTCKRYILTTNNIVLPKTVKRHIKSQFQPLAETFLENEAGQITYAEVHVVGVPRGKRNEVRLLLNHYEYCSK